MRNFILSWMFAPLVFTLPITGSAAELTTDSLQGKWLFTHILMEGDREMRVNYPTEFMKDGTVVYYDAAGGEKSRGSYTISGDRILYQDQNGAQTWKLLSLDDQLLHVDHNGAEMFFEKQ